MVETNPKYRGLKVATQMLESATNEASKMGIAVPKHSDVRTKSGDAWAKSTSSIVPTKRSGVCGDCSSLRTEEGACDCTSGPEYFQLWKGM